MGELRRILDKDNNNYTEELKDRWNEFCQKVLFYGVSKKKMKPPMGMTKSKHFVSWTCLRLMCKCLFYPCFFPQLLSVMSI